MGVSTDAILFYGIGTEDEMTPEDVLRALVKNPSEKQLEYPRDAIAEYLNKFNLEFDIHCSDSCPSPYISAKTIRVWRGFMKSISPDELRAFEESINKDALVELSEKLGWEDPGWKLVSFWG